VAPTATAHISGDRKLTFGQLGAYSNALAAHLLERYGDDRAPVAVLGHREPEMVVAFLGVVKSGRPYVPIDTALPDERIQHILVTSGDACPNTTGTIKLSELGKSTYHSGQGVDHSTSF
jgi:D-alanine--poly(phosphoribitol) ligase subunit 1